MILVPTYNDISSLLTYFDVNAYSPEMLRDDLAETPPPTVEQMRDSMEKLLEKDLLGMPEFKHATACEATDHKAARSFFEHVYQFAFQDGDEPDIDTFRRR